MGPNFYPPYGPLKVPVFSHKNQATFPKDLSGYLILGHMGHSFIAHFINHLYPAFIPVDSWLTHVLFSLQRFGLTEQWQAHGCGRGSLA